MKIIKHIVYNIEIMDFLIKSTIFNFISSVFTILNKILSYIYLTNKQNLKIHSTLIYISFLVSNVSYSQHEVNRQNFDKSNIVFKQFIKTEQNHRLLYTLIATDFKKVISKIDSLKINKEVLYKNGDNKSIVVWLYPAQISALKKYLTQWDSRSNEPMQESFLNDFDPTANGIIKAKINYPQYFIDTMSVGIKENNVMKEDLDTRGRTFTSQLSSSLADRHATDMATIIGGNGSTFYTSEGIIQKAKMYTSSFLNLMPDSDQYFDSRKINVQNHSYGLSIEDYYGIEAQAYDNQVWKNSEMVHVFSAGNSGKLNALYSSYKTTPGFSNLTGTFKQAKNVLTIGGVDRELVPIEISSKGPAYDGRIKPDLVAYGNSGTSESTALVSGCASVLRTALKRHSIKPRFDAIKCLLIAGADDVHTSGPDFYTGYGNVNLYNSLNVLINADIIQAEIDKGKTVEIPFEIKAQSDQIKITLAWIDLASEINASSSLINDLNISVENESGDIYFPFVLNHRPNLVSLNSPAITGIDSINNTEQILIKNPKIGKYKVKIFYNRGTSDTQTFTLIKQTINKKIDITYPCQNTFVSSNQDCIIKFQNTTGLPVSIEYTIGNKRSVISDEQAKTNVYKLRLPDTTATVFLKIKNGLSKDSVDFPIGTIPKLVPIWKCGDSIFLKIDSKEGSATEIFRWNKNAFNKILTTTSNNVLVENNNLEERYISVSSKILNKYFTPRSAVLDLNNVNNKCFYDKATLEKVPNGIAINLDLLTSEGISNIYLQRNNTDRFIDIHNFKLSGLKYRYEDINPDKGENVYRFAIVLIDGTIRYSESLNYFFLPDEETLLYPTIVKSGEGFNVSMGKYVKRDFFIIDNTGKLVFKDILLNEHEYFEGHLLTPGVYYYYFKVDAKIEKGGSIMVIP
jgi:hypothetical protein